MHVKTDLKAGNVVDTVVDQANQLVSQATGFVSAADREASGLYNQAVKATSTAWNTVTGLFS